MSSSISKAGKEIRRGFQGIEDIVDKNLNLRLFPKAPKLPEAPDAPSETEEDRIKRETLRSIIRKRAIPGRGRAATVATSPVGVTGVTPTRRRTLRGGA